MANTNSIAFPNMFDVSANKVATLSDRPSITNRTKLLMLTDPTELYNNPEFGVGLKQYLWQYNNGNVKAILKDNIIEQLRKYEPCVNPDNTAVSDGLAFTGGENDIVNQHHNQLMLTVVLDTVFGDVAEVELSNQRDSMFGIDYNNATGGN